ncbi:hypothetical protein Dsin_017635 [Dipteronia sinensis]|uniref:non-specific serine/threonine protein kinase n=1 Tax=Dipteronia sinensis TaxID=43782 RepID=A0AAE0E6R1_9ROSI|nr:hypothetical protein Dsin_017635 [Dipteronia sinensis]
MLPRRSHFTSSILPFICNSLQRYKKKKKKKSHQPSTRLLQTSARVITVLKKPFVPPPPPPATTRSRCRKGIFTYEELAASTNAFSEGNLVGQGGFGYVYKGILRNGKEVAVKQLKSGSLQGEGEFQAEVETISRIHHKHLVSLVGYCLTTGPDRLVVYNNTLEFHLHGNPTIIHRDIKASNILLDSQFEAKARPLQHKALEDE